MAVSFRDLRRVYLLEKKSNTRLSAIPGDFYVQLREYIENARDSLANNPSIEDVQALMEFANLVKLVGDIISIRQRKIVQMALNASFSEFYEPENLVGWEEDMFRELRTALRRYREKALSMVGLGSGGGAGSAQTSASKNAEVREQPAAGTASESVPEPETSPGPELVKLRVLKKVPAFIGTDYNTYGPFEPGDIVSLPPGVADILLARNFAEVVSDEEDSNATV